MNVLGKIKLRLGEFWWYTVIMFIVHRIGDMINMIIGLWLVPKYVPQAELGAVLPLAQAGGVLGLPLAILLVPFGKFLNVYITQGELGKVKSLLRDVFFIAAVSGLGIVFAACYLMPLIFERMRVKEGMLSWLVVMTGVTSALTPLFTQALQALKKFRALSLVGVLSAPIRLVVLLIVLPLKGLTGYFIGQVVQDGFSILFALTSLKNVLSKKVLSLPYRHHLREIFAYTLPVAVLLVCSRIQGTAEFFVVRHRLPDLESAAYYFLTRFAEIPISLWSAVSVIFFPLISEKHEAGESGGRVLKQTLSLIVFGGGLVSLMLCMGAPHLFNAVPAWKQYAPYSSLLGVASATCVLRAAFACFVIYEMACRKFGFVVYTSFFYLLEALLLYGRSGIKYFERWLPWPFIAWVEDSIGLSLTSVVWFIFACSIVLSGTPCVVGIMRKQRRRLSTVIREC